MYKLKSEVEGVAYDVFALSDKNACSLDNLSVQHCVFN